MPDETGMSPIIRAAAGGFIFSMAVFIFSRGPVDFRQREPVGQCGRKQVRFRLPDLGDGFGMLRFGDCAGLEPILA
jgi:hypothetical protein